MNLPPPPPPSDSQATGHKPPSHLAGTLCLVLGRGGGGAELEPNMPHSTPIPASIWHL